MHPDLAVVRRTLSEPRSDILNEGLVPWRQFGAELFQNCAVADCAFEDNGPEQELGA